MRVTLRTRTVQLAVVLTTLHSIHLPEADAQQVLYVRVFHGRGGSGIQGYSLGKDTPTYGEPPHASLSIDMLAADDSVCLDVVNSQSALYSYSKEVAVDTSKEKLPDFTTLASALNATLPAWARVSSPDARLQALADSSPEWVQKFFNEIAPLGTDLERAQQAIRASDDPQNGMAYAKKEIATLPTQPDEAAFQRWAETIPNKLTKADSILKLALKAYGASLLSARDALKATYAPTVPNSVRQCTAVGKGKTTIVLRVKKAKDFGTRDVDKIATVTATPRYKRASVEAFPLFLISFSQNVPHFGIDQGVVTRGTDSEVRRHRFGAAVAINMLSRGDVGIAPAFGVGVTAEGKLSLSEVFGAVVVSYKDLVRIGFGLGSTDLPSGLRSPAVVGQALPDGTKLDDVVTKDSRRAWFLLVAFPGVTLKSPF